MDKSFTQAFDMANFCSKERQLERSATNHTLCGEGSHGYEPSNRLLGCPLILAEKKGAGATRNWKCNGRAVSRSII
jgi:hypothetical protein